jgi:hypothetical protein
VLQVPGCALHHYSYAELLYNKKIKEKKGKKGIALKGHCKQSAFISKISYAMASWLHKIDRRGYNECFKSIT